LSRASAHSRREEDLAAHPRIGCVSQVPGRAETALDTRTCLLGDEPSRNDHATAQATGEAFNG
jgi:hypothetical protein